MASDFNDLIARYFRQDTGHAFIAIDKAGRIQSWCAGAKTIFGYGEEEVLGKAFSMLFTPEDAAAGIPNWEVMAASQGSAAENDRWMMRSDGSRFWATGTLDPVLDDHSETIGF